MFQKIKSLVQPLNKSKKILSRQRPVFSKDFGPSHHERAQDIKALQEKRAGYEILARQIFPEIRF